ncbi:MAG: right-handed parallel beta-helix repeat-containing protein [Anaerolineales bacterium]|nr:right-handed parallel beta-helix repeat-containing protein [Anaerolineales bacterium]
MTDCTGQPVDATNTCTVSTTPIQAAIDFAIAGETINVEAGTYTENVTIAKQVTLLGLGAGAYTTSFTLNSGANVSGSGNIFASVVNVNAGASIQDGITLATSGGTVNVAEGTYNEQINISKPLTVTGADGAVLDGTGLVSTWTTGVKIKSGNVTFNNIDVTNFTQDGIIVGYEASVPGGLQNVHITNSKISNIQPGYWGFGIYVGYEAEAFKYSSPKLTTHLDYSGLLIEGNEIENAASSSLVLQSITGTPGTLIVRNNYIHDGDNDGIWIDSARNIVIEDNVVQNNADGFYISSYGDAFQGDTPWTYDWSNQQLNGPYGPMNISITGNTIVNNKTYGGIYLEAGHPGTIYINENSITGNTPGVANYLSEQVNATSNWWGCATGPGTAGCDTVSSNVNFNPFLTSDPFAAPPAPPTGDGGGGGGTTPILPPLAPTTIIAETTPLTLAELPGALPEGKTFVAGISVITVGNGQVSFDIPEDAVPPFTILFWDGTQWVIIPSTVVDGQVVFTVTQPGVYVLVSG